ncbi:OBSL1 [Mytilus edulis]|uniref:OBSL1 n=1 Tax=Mytilus edulis TaxID=6550 RepID=A0A8S3SC51_MYTED|nr:OBSL1 [Mytilus edulis]
MFTSEFNPVHCIEGKKLQLQCAVYSEDIHVEWFKDNTKMDQNEDLSIECEGTNRCLTIQHAKMSDAGQYTMVARNVLKYIPVTVKAMLCSDLNPILCIEGEKLQLKCSVYSDDIDVEWLKDEKKIEQNDNTLIENKGRYHCMTVQHAKLSDAGQYIIVAENVQKYITVTVQAMFTSEFNPVNCIEGEKFKLKCSVYSEDIFVKWLKDNTKIKQNENLSIESNGLYHCLTVLDAKLWDAGRYTMIARNVQKHITVTVQAFVEKDLWDQIKRYSRRYQLNSILSTAIKNIQTVDDYDKFEAIVVQCYPIIRLQTPNNDSDHPPNNNLIPVDRNTEKQIIANRELLEKELYPKDYIDGFLEWFILSLEDHEALRNKEHLRKQMAHSFLKTILQPDCIGKNQ